MVVLSIIQWLEDHMMTCQFKEYFHTDCPGCGMQRAFVALLKGDIHDSMSHYPALLPMIALFLFAAAHLRFRFKHGARIVLFGFILVNTIIITSYIIRHCPPV